MAAQSGILIVTDDAHAVIGQLHDMAHYLAEDGYPGFLTWMMDRYPAIKEVPESALSIKTNLDHMLGVVHQYGEYAQEGNPDVQPA